MSKSAFGSFILISILLGFSLGRCTLEEIVPCEPCRPCAPCEQCDLALNLELEENLAKCKAWNIKYERAPIEHKNTELNWRPKGCDIRSDKGV